MPGCRVEACSDGWTLDVVLERVWLNVDAVEVDDGDIVVLFSGVLIDPSTWPKKLKESSSISGSNVVSVSG